ncbi:2-amino-4-hydroxy-6-hydroxymethyldihydropteridine diphosphokinase [Pseudooceanicola endophyticus]|nr:2-amino-4-hydroxy-6-hydroxymethyldihydropteridine diphosphokinase [Pseudooceanicola endophyticus]
MSRSFLVAVGANLPEVGGTCVAVVQSAIARLSHESGQILSVSMLYSTPAFPAGSGPDFVNAALVLSSERTPEEMLAELHRVEQLFGRERKKRWGPRALDLDLIACDDLVLPNEAEQRRWMALPAEDQTRLAPETLILPHPRIQDRAFVLVPLCDVAPDWRHPLLNLTARQMRDDLAASDLEAVKALAEPTCP